jgi:hypothetical protein
MAKRILPFRDYSEHEVFNMAALTTVGATLTNWKPDTALAAFAAEGNVWDSGLVVCIDDAAVLPGDVHTQDSTHANEPDLRGYLGAAHAQNTTHVGYVAYPSAPMKLKAHIGGIATETPIGLTLKETLAYDENMEKMLYYPQKLDECQGVLPGQAVPVLMRGLVLLDSTAFHTAVPTVGKLIGTSTEIAAKKNDGRLGAFTAVALGNLKEGRIGVVLAASADDKILCKLDFMGAGLGVAA